MTVVNQAMYIKQNYKKIIALIPAFNEERNISSTIRDLPEYLMRTIVINDGSTDGTEEVILELENDFRSKLVYLKHEENRGKGSAVITGFRWIQENLDIEEQTAIVLIDGDGQMDLDYIDKMTDPILEGRADFVKASRFRGYDHAKNMPKFRYYGNQILKVLNWIASGHWNITDPQNGYFAISLQAVHEMRIDKLDSGYFFENSMLLETGKQNQRIVEVAVPAIYGNGETSSLKYRHFIPVTSAKLFTGWISRIVGARNHGLVYRLNYYFMTLGFLLFGIGITGIFLSTGGIIFDPIIDVLNHFYIGILLVLLSLLGDMINYKGRVDPSK